MPVPAKWKITILTVSILLPAGILRADVYRWLDAEGNVCIGSNPPGGIDRDSIQLIEKSPAPSPVATVQPKKEAGPPETSRPVEWKTTPRPQATGEGAGRDRTPSLSSPGEGGAVSPAVSWAADFCVFLIIALYGYRGYRRGVLLAALGVLRALCAYGGAYLLAGSVGMLLHRAFGLFRIPAAVIGGVLVYGVILIGFHLADRRIRKAGEKRGPAAVALLNRLAGGMVGALAGGVAVMLLCWVYHLVRGGFGEKYLPDIRGSFADRISKQVISQTAYQVLQKSSASEEKSRDIARVVSEPEAALKDLRLLLQEPSAISLMGSESFHDDFLSGDRDRIRSSPELKRLLDDEAAMSRLQSLAVAPDDYRSVGFREALADRLARAGTGVRKVLNDPQVHGVVEELQKEGLFTAGNFPRLLIDTRFLKILDRVLAQEGGEGKP